MFKYLSKYFDLSFKSFKKSSSSWFDRTSYSNSLNSLRAGDRSFAEIFTIASMYSKLVLEMETPNILTLLTSNIWQISENEKELMFF